MKYLHIRLEELMKERGLTKKKVCSALEVERTNYSFLFDEISFSHLLNICYSLQVYKVKFLKGKYFTKFLIKNSRFIIHIIQKSMRLHFQNRKQRIVQYQKFHDNPALEVERTNFNRYYRDEFQRIDANFLLKLCEYFDCEVGDLFEIREQ